MINYPNKTEIDRLANASMIYWCNELGMRPGRLAWLPIKQGWPKTIENIITKSPINMGFRRCIADGKPEMTFEWIVTECRCAFSNEAIAEAYRRLKLR